MQQHNQSTAFFRRQRAEIRQQKQLVRRNAAAIERHPAVAQPFRAGVQPFCQRIDFVRSRNRTPRQLMVESLRAHRLVGMAQIETVGQVRAR